MPICFNNSKIPVAIRLLDTLRETSFKMDNAFFIFKGFFLSETRANRLPPTFSIKRFYPSARKTR